MIMPEEQRVLRFLAGRLGASARDVGRACLAGKPEAWVGRVLADLDWLGLVTLYHGPRGELAVIQITEKGLRECGCRVAAAGS